MRIIVSFTSYPPRMTGVHKVVESLYRQTMPADEIILYLSLDEFPGMETDLPDTLLRINGKKGFRIEWVQGNLRSHKKYYHAMHEYKDAVVITVDDDTVYAETMISELIESHERFPDAISARRVRIILKNGDSFEPYHKWDGEVYLDEYAGKPRMDLCAIGVGGICYPAADRDHWLDSGTILRIADRQDDLWLKYNEIRDYIPVVYTKASQKDITLEDSQIGQLSSHNLYGNGNDDCMRKLSVLLKEHDEKSYRSWFRELMTLDRYIIEKKTYYSSVYNALFDNLGKLPVYIYGAGKMARYILMILADLGLTQRLTGIIVKDRSGNPSDLYGLSVRPLSEMDPDQGFGVILGVRRENRNEVKGLLTGYAWQNIALDLLVIARFYPIEKRYYKMMSIK